MIRREPMGPAGRDHVVCSLNVDPRVIAVRAPDACLGRGVKDGLAAFDRRGALTLRVGDIPCDLLDTEFLQMRIVHAGSGSEPRARADQQLDRVPCRENRRRR